MHANNHPHKLSLLLGHSRIVQYPGNFSLRVVLEGLRQYADQIADPAGLGQVHPVSCESISVCSCDFKLFCQWNTSRGVSLSSVLIMPVQKKRLRRRKGILSLFKTPISTWGKSKGEGGGSPGRGKGEGPLEKVQVLWICTGVGVLPSRVILDEYRTWGAQNDRLVCSNKPD